MKRALIYESCGHSFEDKNKFMDHKCTPMRKDEMDEE
jgi:hypothetical protein